MRVGFVGAGRMGAPMVRRLVEAGHEVDAVGRTDEKRRAITELGATPVDDLSMTAASEDAVVVCVFTDEQVKQICLDGDLVAKMFSDPQRKVEHALEEFKRTIEAATPGSSDEERETVK